MGKVTGNIFADKHRLNQFMYYLINDIKALEKMLDADMLEKDMQRIGAEQELCLLDKTWRPATISMKVLDELNDENFTTEHSQFNLEINLEPLEFKGDCLSQMERRIDDNLQKLNKIVKRHNGEFILVGILPTIRRSDLKIENLTPLPRYHLLGEVMYKMRGGPFEFRIEGVDELITQHDSIMFEGCNTSFQVHLQVPPQKFVNFYNWAQAVSGPVLAAACNSPILLGKRLWTETRIALFQQSVDIRNIRDNLREKVSRISFGTKWVRDSITEIFKEDIARHRVIIGTDIDEDSLELLEQGIIPTLPALQIHNSTLYKWNRPCYGVTNGKPHLRIENRTLPAGPTVSDEIANAAFWLGLIQGCPQKYINISQKMEFDDAKMNFVKAAQLGLETQFKWLDDKIIPADKLILEELLPIAKQGLQSVGIDEAEIEEYLTLVEKRVKKKETGATWILNSFEKLTKKYESYEACVAITAGIVHRQKSNLPVHKWKLAEIDEAGDWINRYWKVEQIMTTDIFTVQANDSVYFASNLMSWKKIRYLPVEDDQGRLVGLLTDRSLLEYYSTSTKMSQIPTPVEEVMIKKPITLSPEALSIEALTLMRKSGIGCLPVVLNDRLVGILTEYNFMNLSEQNIRQLVEESEKYLQNERQKKINL